MTKTALSYVRFSSEKQALGDSLRRQVELSKAYAEKHGLVLDESLSLRDLGVSAFRSKNLEKGALGAFIEAIEKGLVKPGSLLLVESLDRISRNTVLEALNVFTTIINKGISIVTLVDERIYSKESIGANWPELVVSIAQMARAHDESLTKSHRRTESWKKAYSDAKATGKKITGKVPFWLTSDRQIKPAEVEVVKLIFDRALNGIGMWRTCGELNKMGVRPPGHGKGWGTSTVYSILVSEAVRGNLTIKQKGELSEVIEGYYPRIIDDATFFEIQRKIVKRPPGKVSPKKINLFTSILYCAHCHGKMQVDTATLKSGVTSSRIVCTAARRLMGCESTPWNYEQFERQFLDFVTELDLPALLNEEPRDEMLSVHVDSLHAELESNKRKIDAMLNALEFGEAESVMKRIKELEAERKVLESKYHKAKQRFEEAQMTVNRLSGIQATVNGLYKLMSEADEEKRVLLRYSVSEAIRSLVEKIVLAPRGTGLQLDGMKAPDTARSFTVHFRSGMVRVLKQGWTMKLNLRK